MRGQMTAATLAALAALVALCGLLTACGSGQQLSVAEYAELVCGDGAEELAEARAQIDFDPDDGLPTNSQAIEALAVMEDYLTRLDPPEGVEAYHALQIKLARELTKLLELEDPNERMQFTTLFGLGIAFAADEMAVAQDMPPAVLEELNAHGCDLDTEDPFDFGDDEQEAQQE